MRLASQQRRRHLRVTATDRRLYAGAAV